MANSKLNNIETLIFQALIDMEISHEEFITILKEKDKYEKIKDSLSSENEKYEIIKIEYRENLKQKLNEKLLSISCHKKKTIFVVYV